MIIRLNPKWWGERRTYRWSCHCRAMPLQSARMYPATERDKWLQRCRNITGDRSCTYRSAQSLLRHKSSDSRHKYESSRLKLVDTTRYIRIQQLKVWFIDLKEVLGNWLAGACCAPISRYCGCLESSYIGSMIQWEVTLILNGMWSFIMSLYRRNVG